MLRCVAGMVIGLLAVGLFTAPLAAQQKSWSESQLKKLSGRWSTVREEQVGPDKSRRSRVDLEFTEGQLSVRVTSEKTATPWSNTIKVTGVEEIKGIGIGPISRLHLQGNEVQKVEVFYDFVGEKLILVGRIGFRPWEGFPLSGEYSRPAKSK